MSDRRDDEHEEWDEWSERPSEGVRVAGGTSELPAPGGRFALPGDPVEPVPDAQWAPDPLAGRGTELQHWADPPTGEVPRVLGGGTPDDDFDSWASVTGQGPRFRSGDADWADADWGEGALKDETVGVGSLSDLDEVTPPRRRRGGRRGRGQEQDPVPAPDEPREPREARGFLEGPPRPVPTYDDYADDYGEGRDEHVDITQRLITGGAIAVVALVAFAAGRGVTVLLATLIVGLAAFELYNAFQRAGYHPATAIGLLGCLAIVPMAYSGGVTFQAFPLAMFLVVGFTFLWYLFEVVRARPTINISLTLLPFGWVGVFGGFAGLLLAPNPSGTGLLLGVVICAVGSDVAAYFVGRSMGRTPMFPRISPHKTMEGLVGGAVAAVVLGGLVGTTLHPWADKGIGAGIMLGFLVAIMAPLGDLVSSLVKRDLGIKDFGTFLPGHGGILDRFDAILFCLPVAYYWAYHLFT